MHGGDLVYLARTRAGVTQAQLGARAGMAQNAVSRIERGEVDAGFGTVTELVRACGCLLPSCRPGPGRAGVLAVHRESRWRCYLILPPNRSRDSWQQTGGPDLLQPLSAGTDFSELARTREGRLPR